MRINGHGHLLPYPHQIPRFMKDREIFWVEEDMSCMCQGRWRRPITDDSFFLSRKLEWMEANGIDKEVLLNLSQLYCNGYSRQDAKDVTRFQNDFNASVQEECPEKFISGFVVQPLYVDDALDEIRRCVEDHHMPLLCLPSHFINKEGKWTAIADESLIPIFELADQYHLAVEIHPYNAEDIIQLEDKYWRFHLIWMCAQTADAWHFYSLLDFPDRFPNVRTCFAHGNQFGQMGYGRRVQGYKGRPDLFEGARSPEETNHCTNIFFDSIVHDVLSFEMLVRRAGVSQIVAGLDDPYPLGEIESVPGCYPGKVIDEGVDAGIISSQDRDHIWNDNVTKWIFGDK
ncbi:MAG: amidohydrolase family protein [Saprospiraceae bacterium]|nr:amidohydrolase family protein [Saprospiraceae bacterium]